MGFNKVYRSLQEIFPQIDARVLRAVAIEHNKDADAAAEAVISEVIPFLSALPGALPDPSSRTSIGERSKEVIPSTALLVDISDGQSSEGKLDSSTTSPGVLSLAQVGVDGDAGSRRTSENKMVSDSVENAFDLKVTTHERNNIDKGCVNLLGIEVLEDSETFAKISYNEVLENSKEVQSDSAPCHMLQMQHDDADEGKGFVSDKLLQYADSMEIDESPLVDTIPIMETSRCILKPQQESTTSPSLTSSTEAIEDIILDEKNNKKALSFAMQCLKSLMREVDLKEQAAERAKLEAAVLVKDALAKVEEFKQMVQRVDEEKCMYAGEVHREKAIHDTGLKGLHLRMLSLSTERDKSLKLLIEMHRSLKERLAAVENEIIIGEQDKEEKVKTAVKAYAEQETALEKVQEEMRMLKQLAEDNANLNGFLFDRGRAVDALQGEIAVVYEDAKQLKEKLDGGVPLSELLSSAQFSGKLASSSLSAAARDASETTDDGWEIFEAPVAA